MKLYLVTRVLNNTCLEIYVILVLLITFMKALDQPQLIFKSSSSNILESQFASYLKKAVVLQPVHMCSFENLTECHYSEYLYNIYYETCFKEQVCPRNNYYCINGNGFTVHICGEFSDCLKRNRNIVVFDESNPGVVDVYSIPCPDGYFQFSRRNCFHACVKDDSIILTKESTTVTRAQGFCNFERNYYNMDGLTSFSLGSKHDTCVDVNQGDHGIHCRDSEDLMPSNSDSISTKELILIVIAVSVVFGAVVTVLICVQLRRKDQRYQDVPVSYNRNEDGIEIGNAEDADGVRPGQVKKEKNTNVTHNNIHIHSERDIQVQFGNGSAEPIVDNLASGQNCADNHSQNYIDEPRMENLKSLGNQEEDSGIASFETTHVKRPY